MRGIAEMNNELKRYEGEAVRVQKSVKFRKRDQTFLKNEFLNYSCREQLY
jgi:hypothetical protein